MRRDEPHRGGRRIAAAYVRDPSAAQLESETFLRHIGVYAYRPEVLLKWTSLPASLLEAAERLEQLRALEAGLSIGVGIVAEAAAGVDTLEDAKRAEQRLGSEQPS